MTGVYSGGLAYEYSMEANGYGMVNITDSSSVVELPNFADFKKALANNPSPSGDGGYNSTGGASQCPSQSDNWSVKDDSLPAIPESAKAVSHEPF
jgi:1,3-beta-glucanosyltransferase GAS5